VPTNHVLATAAVAWMIGIPTVAASPSAHRAHSPTVHRSQAPTVHRSLAPSAAASTAGPQLGIAITDGRTSAAEGDQLTYTTKIRNLGTSAVKGLKISESMPVGLRFVSADHGGAAGDGQVAWVADLAAGEELTLTAVARVGRTPQTQLRLATVACATAKGGTRPLVCATHSDLLPAGAAAAGIDQPTSHRVWYGIGALTAVGIALAAFVLLRRRRRSHPARLQSEDTDGVVVGAYRGGDQG
jgi:uncharacterized repeat protein (TIGR01451 family)